MNTVKLTTKTSAIIYEMSNIPNYHNLDTIPVPIVSITLGENVNAYGKSIVNFEGINQINYLHFKKGRTHILDPPVMFLSFHIDKNI